MDSEGLNSEKSWKFEEEKPDSRSPKEREPSNHSESFSVVISHGDVLLKKFFWKISFRRFLTVSRREYSSIPSFQSNETSLIL
jgi:hypothetical protein